MPCTECSDSHVTLKIFTGFSSPDLVATPSTEGINKLLTYQNESGSIISCFIFLPFGAFFFLFYIGSNKSLMYNCTDNGVEIYRSQAAFFLIN